MSPLDRTILAERTMALERHLSRVADLRAFVSAIPRRATP